MVLNLLGKMVGGLAGMATGKLILFAIGLLLGHQFDRGFARWTGSRAPRAFGEVAFAVMGHLAKADGRVSEDEIRVARSAMHTLDLDARATQAAMQAFNLGKETGFDLGGTLETLRQQSADIPEVGRQLVAFLLPIIVAKHEVSAGEREVLWRVAQAFELNRVEVAQMEASARLKRHFVPKDSGPARVDAVTRAFATLGLEPDAGNAEIKTAYRRLMNRYHPDKLAAAGDDAAIADASRKTRVIREAYELLRARRGFR